LSYGDIGVGAGPDFRIRNPASYPLNDKGLKPD